MRSSSKVAPPQRGAARRVASLLPLALLGSFVAACRTSESAVTSAADASVVSPPAPSVAAAPVLPADVTLKTDVPLSIAFAPYDNATLGFTVEYPTFVKMEAPDDEVEGRSFDYFGRVYISVRGRAASTDKSIDELFRAETPAKDAGSRVVTSTSRTKDGFVVEGRSGARAFYDRVLSDDKTHVALHIDYELASKERFERAAKHIGDSLRFGVHPTIPLGAVTATPPR